MFIVAESVHRAVADAYAATQPLNAVVVDISEAEKKEGGSVAGKLVFFGGLAHFATLHRVLQPSGVLEAFLAVEGNESNKNAVLMQLILQGFLNSNVDIDGNGIHARAQKSGFVEGASVAVKFTPVQKPKWTVVADEDDEEDIVDEDDLLDDADDILSRNDDCGPGKDGKKKRRCKDCTCGRKDEDDQPIVSEAELKQMVSSCGNCYKGDAFRCGGCPFLGQPAFKPGMGKVVLNLDSSDDF
ncbi:hypothetical protein, variant [Aphanomyces astaci]|uniref:Anamorsin homolog n=1 Tax=Aphanomyces astaci TaxID=112090 RepID=W4FXW2_APHAT|nr:hypothetical protein, variant [Aphanomyces astaci]ETV72332.1 hypothetical protein, variant [Aphanomyces astaci]|eukprot:XP_009838014.1 hypothetical protein, variant [Aphanomyces astaci]